MSASSLLDDSKAKVYQLRSNPHCHSDTTERFIMPTTPHGVPAKKLTFFYSYSPSSIDPVTRTQDNNREVHGTAAVVAEKPE